MLNGTEDKDGNKALATCTPESIANFMLHMVTQGLSVAKKQCYPIVYGNQLTLSRSYFGTLAVVKRLNGIKNVYSEVIRKGQEFKIGNLNGVKFVEKHDITFETLDADIIGAYCVIETDHGNHTEIMTMKQIQTAWNASKTSQSVHKSYPDQMAMRTVINRACKKFVNTSDDSDLLVSAFNETTENEYENETSETKAKKTIEQKANSKEFIADYEVEENVNKETGEVTEGELPADDF
jgi:recombination protein RecT